MRGKKMALTAFTAIELDADHYKNLGVSGRDASHNDLREAARVQLDRIDSLESMLGRAEQAFDNILPQQMKEQRAELNRDTINTLRRIVGCAMFVLLDYDRRAAFDSTLAEHDFLPRPT
jgi:hypothetical protein